MEPESGGEAMKDSPDICARNHGGNELSKKANKHTQKSTDTAFIYAWLIMRGDGTCDEAEVHLGMNHQTCSARFSELKRDGLIEPTVKRRTRTGCLAQAWRIREYK